MTIFVIVLVLLVLILIIAVSARVTLFSSYRVRRMRWRIMFRLRPGPGFATLAELALRWSRLAALRHGRRARPSMRLHRRITARTTEYAIRLGRAQYGRRVFARAEDQTIILSLPRSGKSGMLGDRVIDHPGAALVTESRPDIYTATAGYRARLGPIEVFNPENVSGIPSTFRWGMTAGCHDPSEAIRRAVDLVGAVATAGEMAWWVEKSAAALAAGMHAAALLGGDMGDVWAWSNGQGAGVIDDARAHPAASRELFGALAELDRPGKTADSIRLTMSKALTWLAIPDIRAMVSGPAARPFDVGAFTDNRGTIYMLAPGGDGAPSAPLFRCFASYVHRAARRHGLAQPHRKLDPGLLFALDELHLCLAAGTLVLTRDGYIPIESVNVGGRVLTHTGHWRRVLAKTCNGTKPVVSVHAHGVPGLRATPDHRLWIRPGGGQHAKQHALHATPVWEQAGSTLGSYVHLPLPPVEENPVSEADWWVIGRWLGDGHRGGHGNGAFFISCSHQELPELLNGLGARAGHVSRNRTGCQIAIRDEEGGWLKAILKGCGSGAAGKRVPAIALALSPEKAEALLTGYLSADGHYLASGDEWRATSTSRALLLSMAMVAQRARGVVASVYAGRPPREHVIEGRVVQARQEWTLSFRNGDWCRKSGWIDGAGAWKKVRKIQETGTAEVWDLQIEDDESFIAEGCAVHNCPVDLPAWLADSAGKGIQVVAVVHSTGQLRDKYGEHGARTVWSTAGTKIFLPGIHDTDTLEDVSRLCGTLEDGGKAQRVMPPELLARLPDWHALVLSVNRSPVVIRFRPSWRRIEARFGRAPRPLPVYGPDDDGTILTPIPRLRPVPPAIGDSEDHGETA